MNEIWKAVKGYEGLYEVSNLGRVRSLPRATTKGKIMKLYRSQHNGYVYCSLSKNNNRKTIRVHRLVLEAFTNYKSRSSNLVIDHIDGDKTNNRLDNLDAVTMSENMKRAYRLGLESPRGMDVINLDTGEVFMSYSAASEAIGGSRGEMVARVCRGERSHYRGHHFAHYSDYLNDTIPKYKGSRKRKTCETLWR